MSALSKLRTTARWIIRAAIVYFLVQFIRARRIWVQGLRHIEAMDFPVATFKSFLTRTMLGNIPVMAANLDRAYDFRVDQFTKYGSSFLWVMPIWNPHPTLSTTDPAIVKHILKDNFENYLKSESFNRRLSDLLGSGIFGINHGVRYCYCVEFSHIPLCQGLRVMLCSKSFNNSLCLYSHTRLIKESSGCSNARQVPKVYLHLVQAKV